jgi:hypothetical protein
MSNSMSDDYFSFMSEKWEKGPAKRRPPAATLVRPSDTIDFVEETQIEVVESIVSDTMIQRIFKRFAVDV